MTQLMAYRGFSLQGTANSTKVLITLFLLLSAIATAVGIVMYQVRTGLTVEGGAEYYAGEHPSRSALELLDSTHPHLFTMAFLVFILGHIFALTRVGNRVKTGMAFLAFSAVLLDAAAPWVITFAWPPFAVVQLANTVLLAAVILTYLTIPLYEMWFASSASAS